MNIKHLIRKKTINYGNTKHQQVLHYLWRWINQWGDGRCWFLWLLLLLADFEGQDDKLDGLEGDTNLLEWLLNFFFSYTLSSALICRTFVSFKPAGRTQLQRKPTRLISRRKVLITNSTSNIYYDKTHAATLNALCSNSSGNFINKKFHYQSQHSIAKY